MNKIIKNCFIARIIRALVQAFPTSVLASIIAFFKVHWNGSIIKRSFDAIFLSPSRIEMSKSYDILKKTNNRLRRFGEKNQYIWESSLVVRAVSGFWGLRIVSQSAALSFLKKLGMKRVLIAMFALYLPIDIIVRDVLKIGFLASLWDEAFVAFCVCYILYRICLSKEDVAPRLSPLDTALTLFLCIGILLLGVVSPKMSTAIAGYRAVCQFMLWFFVLTRLIEDDKDAETLYFTFCAMAALIAAHGIYQYITKAPMPATWVSPTEDSIRTRVYSIFGSPNIMGSFMVMTAPMIAAFAYYAKNTKMKILAWCITGLLCLATLFTFSRGAWLGMAVAVIVFAILVDLRLLIIAGVAVAGILFFVPEIADRIGFLFTPEFADANNRGGRAGRWKIGIDLWKKNKLFGFGLGRYGGAIAMQTRDVKGIYYYYMDNYYLKTLTEMGLLGLVSYVWLLLRNFVCACRGILKTKENRISYLACGIIAGQMGVLGHSFFENIFEVPYMNAYFWGLSAVVIYIGFFRNKNKKEAETE